MKNRLAITVGAAVALAGVVLAWRALAPLVPTAQRTAPASAPEHAEQPVPQPSLLPASLDDPVTSENVAQRAVEIVNRLRSAPDLRRLPDEREDVLLSEARQQVEAYLGGSFERYVECLRRHDANHRLLNPELPEEERTKAADAWRTRVSGIALRHTSVEDVRVRLRFWNGEPVPPDEMSDPYISAAAPTRYGLGGNFDEKDARVRRLTVYEVLVPVAYEFEHKEVGGRGPAWWGLWLASHPDEPNRWLPWRSVLYDPMKIGAQVPPAI